MNNTHSINKLLIVEDAEDDVFMIRNCLEEAGITCVIDEAKNGDEAIRKMSSADYDIIIMDFYLPDANAIDIIREVRVNNDEEFLPIISLTGSGTEQIAVELMKLGVIDYLSKDSLTTEKLTATLEYAVRKISRFKERKEYLQELQKIGLYDELTSLPNRNLFYDRLEQAIKVSDREKTAFALLFMDLNGFKTINDEYGHTTGDEVLSGIGERLRSIARETDTIARYGGDEFVVILPNTRTVSDAVLVANKIVQAVNEPLTIRDNTFNLTIAIGIAIYPEHGTNIKEIIHIADQGMYEAKKLGKPCYCL